MEGQKARAILFRSFVVGGHFIVDVPAEGDPHLRNIVSSKNVTDVVCLYLHLYLLTKRISDIVLNVG